MINKFVFIFYFVGYPHDKLQKRVLHMMVLDYDKFSRDDPIGEINIPLCEVDFSQTFQIWKDLNPISKVTFRSNKHGRELDHSFTFHWHDFMILMTFRLRNFYHRVIAPLKVA